MMPCTGQWPAGSYTGFIAIASPALDKTAQLYNLTGGGTLTHAHDISCACTFVIFGAQSQQRGPLNLATLQTDPERFGCIEGQGDYSGPDGHTSSTINAMGDMEPALEAPPTPQRGTGRKRGRPKGSGRGRASSKGASPSHSPKPVTSIGSFFTLCARMLSLSFSLRLQRRFRCSASSTIFFSL